MHIKKVTDRKKSIIFFLVFSPFSMPVADDCNDPTTQAEMNYCAFEYYKKADKILNSTYQKVINLVDDDEQKKLLKVAQNKWISYRDSDCEFQASSSKGGSIHPLEIADCLEKKTKQRTKELDSMLRILSN